MPSLSIRQWPAPIHMRRGTILDAALANDVPVPYHCRSGQCGTCKCRLLYGTVKHDNYLPTALSERERAEGWVLACRARPKTDVEIDYGGELDTTTPSLERRMAVVAQKEQLTHDITRLVLALNGGPFRFKAGQSVQLYFDGLPPRSYSMANLSGSTELEFFIREMPNGTVSRHVARHLALGDTVRLEGPSGQAYLRKDSGSPILAVAGGSGLAPLLAIAREAARTQPQRVLHLYFGVRSARDVFAQQNLSDLAAIYPNLCTQVVLSEACDYVNGYRTGFVHEAVAADFENLSEMQVYAAGPPPMVKAVTQMTVAKGARSRNVYSDPFTSATPEPAAAISRPLKTASRYSRRLQQGHKPADSDTFVPDMSGSHFPETDVSKPNHSKPNVESLITAPMPKARSETAAKVAADFAQQGLGQSERPAAENIFRLLIKDGAVGVRETLSAHLKTRTDLPHDIALALATDVESVALPLLAYSEVLNETDLMEIIAENSRAKQTAIAQRRDVAAPVADALIDSGNEAAVAKLVANEATDLGIKALARIMDDYGDNEAVTDAVLRRVHLPPSALDRSGAAIPTAVPAHHNTPEELTPLRPAVANYPASAGRCSVLQRLLLVTRRSSAALAGSSGSPPKADIAVPSVSPVLTPMPADRMFEDR